MEPKLGDMMKVNPSLTGLTDWIEGQVIDVEHNPFIWGWLFPSRIIWAEYSLDSLNILRLHNVCNIDVAKK